MKSLIAFASWSTWDLCWIRKCNICQLVQTNNIRVFFLACVEFPNAYKLLRFGVNSHKLSGIFWRWHRSIRRISNEVVPFKWGNVRFGTFERILQTEKRKHSFLLLKLRWIVFLFLWSDDKTNLNFKSLTVCLDDVNVRTHLDVCIPSDCLSLGEGQHLEQCCEKECQSFWCSYGPGS